MLAREMRSRDWNRSSEGAWILMAPSDVSRRVERVRSFHALDGVSLPHVRVAPPRLRLRLWNVEERTKSDLFLVERSGGVLTKLRHRSQQIRRLVGLQLLHPPQVILLQVQHGVLLCGS